MRHLIILSALATTYAFAKPAETFEQMCTKNASGYGKIVKMEKLKPKRGEGLRFDLVEDGRKKTATCAADGKGVLTFKVVDVKAKAK